MVSSGYSSSMLIDRQEGLGEGGATAPHRHRGLRRQPSATGDHLRRHARRHLRVAQRRQHLHACRGLHPGQLGVLHGCPGQQVDPGAGPHSLRGYQGRHQDLPGFKGRPGALCQQGAGCPAAWP